MKNYLLQFLIVFFGVSSSHGMEITQPASVDLKNCATYTLEWTEHNWNTDRYDVILILNGTMDRNGDGIPEVAVNEWVGYQEITESWIYGPLARKYDFTVDKGWTGWLTACVVARRRGNDWAEQSRTYRGWAIVSETATPPVTKSFFYCEEGNYTLELQPTTAGDQLKWYDNLNSTQAFNIGNSYTGYFKEGLRTMYVSEVKNSGGCGFESLRMPVTVYVFPSSLGISERFVTIQPEADNRLGEQQCSRPGTYYDLESAVPISGQSLDLVDGGLIPGVTTSFSLAVSDWKDKPYGNSANAYRVCNSHLPAGNFTKRTFYRDVNITVTIQLKDPISQEVIATNSFSCERKEFMKVTVQKDNVCQANFADARRIYQNDGFVCGGSEDVILCPNTTAIIGSTVLFNDDPTSFYTFRWSPSIGMSSSNVRNPEISYNTIILPSGQRYIKYNCTVKRNSKLVAGVISEQNYCV